MGNIAQYLQNYAGRGVEFLDLANALASGSPGALIHDLAMRSQALQDPALRQQLQGSPFQAGIFGVPLGSNLPTPASAQMGPAEGPSVGPVPTGAPDQLVPQLPPLDPLAAATQQQIAQNPQGVARAQLGLPVSDVTDVIGRTPQLMALAQAFPGARFTYGSNGRLNVTAGGAETALTHLSLDRAKEVAAATGGTVVQMDDGRYNVYRAPQAGGGVASPATLSDLGIDGGAPAPAPTAAPTGAPVPPPALPAGYTPFPSDATPASGADIKPGASFGPLTVNPNAKLPPKVQTPLSPAGQSATDQTSAAQDAKLGFPSPAPVPQTSQFPPPRSAVAAPPSVQTGPKLGPGERMSVKVAPGVTKTFAGPPPPKEDFSTIASQRVIPLLRTAKQAIKVLREAGVLTDDLQGAAINGARLYTLSQIGGTDLGKEGVANSVVSTALQAVGLDPAILLNPAVVGATKFIQTNLKSTVPLLARGFGEQRTNRQEEKRLADALSFSSGTASSNEAVIDNFLYLFSNGQAPPDLQAQYPVYSALGQSAFQQAQPGQ